MDKALESLFQVQLYWIGQIEKLTVTGVSKVIDGIEGHISLAFDQSSTQTGICITDAKGDVIGVCDLINLGLPDRDMFVRFFRKWLSINFEDYDIDYVVCERAEQNAPQQYTKKILQKLIGVLEDFAYDHNITCYQIDNKTWKKWFLADDCFKGRRVQRDLVKEAVKEKAIMLYSSLYYYYRTVPGTDSADAIGIMYGFIKEFFRNGMGSLQKVCVLMPLTPKRKYSLDFRDYDECLSLVKEYPEYYSGMKLIVYNNEMTLEDNARRIINFFDRGAMLLCPDEKTRALWKYTANKELKPNCVMIVRHG